MKLKAKKGTILVRLSSAAACLGFFSPSALLPVVSGSF